MGTPGAPRPGAPGSGAAGEAVEVVVGEAKKLTIYRLAVRSGDAAAGRRMQGSASYQFLAAAAAQQAGTPCTAGAAGTSGAAASSSPAAQPGLAQQDQLQQQQQESRVSSIEPASAPSATARSSLQVPRSCACAQGPRCGHTCLASTPAVRESRGKGLTSGLTVLACSCWP
jgi:hypothetical protein